MPHHNETITVSVGEQAGALTTLAGLTIISSTIFPFFIRKRILASSKHALKQKILSGCLCFGAGVLLATIFLHLLPEAHEDIQKAIEKGFMPQTSFPVAEAIVCCGFFLVYLVEVITEHFISHGHGNPAVSIGIDNNAFESNSQNIKHKSSSSVEEGVEDQRGLMEGERTSVLKAITITIAFSFHSLMEGLAIGLQNNSIDLWLLVAVVCAHKLVVAFSLGMELLQEGLKKASFLAAMITFSLASPIGGVIGAIILSVSNEDTATGVLVPTILNGLAGGCILFVTFCEVLERERSRKHGSFVRILSSIAGFLVMCGLESIPVET